MWVCERKKKNAVLSEPGDWEKGAQDSVGFLEPGNKLPEQPGAIWATAAQVPQR
jgi:hypothetical protein